MRLYIAIDMPSTVLTQAEQIQEHLKSLHIFKGPYTKPNGLHITLKFLGDVDEKQLPVIQEALRTVQYPPLKAQVGAVDNFTHGAHVKVIFLHIICSELAGLAQAFDDRLPTFAKDEREFIGHLTLARVKGTEDRDALLRALNAIEVPKIEFTISSFVLKKSELSVEGPRYTDVEEYSLL